MRRNGFWLVAVLALAAGAAPASASAATTFGANLNRPANNTATCLQIPLFPISQTCSVESIHLGTGESGFPPAGDGVVTRVRVKVGPVTGPMQIVVEEALRRDNPISPGNPTYACCKAVNASPVFTPAANAITTVPVNLPVKQDLAPGPSGFYVDQHLALSVLAGNVPIPASMDPNASVGAWFPAWQVGQERAGSYGTSGAVILFNADWDPVGGGGAGATAGAPLTLPGRAARVRNGKALVDLLCNLGEDCAGKLRLQNQKAAPAGRLFGPAKKRRVTYAKSSFTIPAGKSKKVRAKLKRPGKQLLKRKKKPKVWANVTVSNAPGVVAPVKIKLKP